MNNTFAKRVEIATNLSIIVVALIGGAVLVNNYLLHPYQAPASEIKKGGPDNSQTSRGKTAPSGPAEGTRLSVTGVDWGGSRQTVVLALSNKCHFCSESAPFYKRLAADLAQVKDVRLVAVFPQEVGEAKKYLDGLGVPIQTVMQATLSSLEVRGTPTLIIVDSTGEVKQSWVGRLSAERESEVLSRVKV
jgi:hypothetical protein